ncbi:BTAD domain-containing putative transcriptional regulator [Streptomyces sp. NPDC001941]|uniref:AfsR/SARP family transcriptional regulator n=1 Tax=Streptomyces sp. NPDC001941 TaxID=3154659 RepID=UPI0033346DCC
MTRFGLLGPLSLHDGTTDRPVTSPKGRVLLAALLLRAGRVVSSDALKQALWGERPPATADASLSNHVVRLRRALSAAGADPARLAAVAPGYLLRVADGELDTDLFEAALERARLAQRRGDWAEVARGCAGALALWRGDPLADVPCFAEAEPQARRVEQLRELRLQALEWSFDAELHLGRPQGIVPELTALTAAHPLREGFHRQLMLALHRTDRQAEALAAFQRLRRTLVEELGIEPGTAVRAAHQEVLAPAPPPEPVPPAPRPPLQLPAPVSDFTGRAEEVETVGALLRRESGGTGPRPVVLSGMGGIGKTTLAVHVAHRLREEFPGGQLYADLRGFGPGAPRAPHDLLARFLSDLGVCTESLPEDTDDRAALFRAALAGRRVLVVLDNARDAAQVAPLLPGGDRASVVVTSRHTLADLPGAALVPLAPLDRAEQHTLLAAVCGPERMHGEPAAARDILAACGGLPLALRIVGGRLASRPGWPLALLAERLTPHDGRLSALTMGGLAVQETFAMSYLAMRDSGRPVERAAARAFRLLGLWPEHALAPESAAALLGRGVRETVELLEVLADAHLLQTPAPGRYAFHDLLGEYAAERAAEEEPPGERAAAVRRLLVWYVTALTAACSATTRQTQPPPPPAEPAPAPPPRFTGAEDALRWCVREIPAVKHAIDTAGALGRPDLAWRIAVGLFGYAGTYWWTGEWDVCLRRAMEIAEEHGDTEGRAWLYRRIAVAHGMAYRNEECLENLSTALELFTADGDLDAQASILGNMSALYVQMELPREGLEYARRSRALYRVTGNTRNEALVLSRIASALQLAGDLEGAVEHYRQMVPLQRADDLPTSYATTLTNLAEALTQLGRRDEAFAALREALAIRHRLGDHGGEADCLVYTARAHHAFGEWDRARDCWLRCLDLARAHDLPLRVKESLEGLAELPGETGTTVPRTPCDVPHP